MSIKNISITSEASVTPLVYAENDSDKSRAEALAKRLNTDMVSTIHDTKEVALFLHFGKDGLSLTDGKLVLRGDLTHMLPRLKKNNLNQELLVKAAKIKNADEELTAIDATAGLGEDSLLLAAAGFSVQLYEYNPVIAALLDDALKRASEIPELSEIVGRMCLIESDSLSALPQLKNVPDLILLDPMFPARQKSALIKKKFQLLQQLEQPCTDEEALLHAALSVRPRKIVIKRPAKGPYLAGIKPNYSLSGKAVRYDCFVFPKNE